jgi:hypothetical protein
MERKRKSRSKKQQHAKSQKPITRTTDKYPSIEEIVLLICIKHLSGVFDTIDRRQFMLLSKILHKGLCTFKPQKHFKIANTPREPFTELIHYPEVTSLRVGDVLITEKPCLMFLMEFYKVTQATSTGYYVQQIEAITDELYCFVDLSHVQHCSVSPGMRLEENRILIKKNEYGIFGFPKSRKIKIRGIYDHPGTVIRSKYLLKAADHPNDHRVILKNLKSMITIMDTPNYITNNDQM